MFETIILIGPGTELFPMVNDELPKFCLPIINKPMILHTMEFLEAVSTKFIVVGLSEHKNHFMNAIGDTIGIPVEYVGIETYDGTVSSLISVSPRISSEDIIVCKGDIVTNMDIQGIISNYLNHKRTFLTILGNSSSETSLVGYKDDNLLFYSNDGEDVPFYLLKKGLMLSKDLDVIQFYILKSSLIKRFNPEHFSFKHDLLPNIVKDLLTTTPVGIHRPGKSGIHQIKTIENYLSINMLLKRHTISTNEIPKTSESNVRYIKEYVKKCNLKDLNNVIGHDVKIDDVLLLNSIIGHECEIGKDSKVISSLLMDHVSIGDGSYIEGSLIGSRVVIIEGSVLIKCKVSPGYVFDKVVNVKSQVFSI